METLRLRRDKIHSCDLQVRVDEGEHSPERNGRGGRGLWPTAGILGKC